MDSLGPIVTSLLLAQNAGWTMLLVLLFHAISANKSRILKSLKRFRFLDCRAEYKLKAKITYKNNMLWLVSYPLNFLAVNKMLNDLLLDDALSKEKYRYEINEYPGNDRDDVLFFAMDTPYKIVDDIFVQSSVDKTTHSNEKGCIYEYIELEISIYTSGKNFASIKRFVDETVEKYNEEKLDNMKEQHVFVYSHLDKENHQPFYTEYPFSTTKTFDNMFFDGKESVIRRIDNFANNKAEYLRLGMPYTLGILLYGQPGTGKTGFIKGLAKHTKRHVVIIPVSKIKNIDMLKSVFLNVYINHVKIPNNKRLYVFEDADCSAWRNILVHREFATRKEEPCVDRDTVLIDLIQKLKKDEGIDDKSGGEARPSAENEKMTLTLSEVLELLDGIVEIDGRMIVMTTNYIDVMDEALIRPGRFDLKLEFDKLAKDSIARMFKLWFPDREIPKHVYDGMKDRAFTQASIGSIFASRDFDEIYKRLVSET